MVAGPSEVPSQEIRPFRDAFVAAGDIHYHAAAGPDLAPAGAQPGTADDGRAWGNVPARNRLFTGREELLATVRTALLGGGAAVVALHGMGGVGKTQLASEYAHRFTAAYDVVWWIAAERAELIAEQFAELAVQAGYAPAGTTVAAARRAALGTLHARDRWLLVFDNAEAPDDLAGWLPGGMGHVLITSRSRRWAEVAIQVEVDVMTRAESISLLRDRIRGITGAEAERIAEALGDLPLAVAQAGAYMEATGMPPGEYLELLATRAAKVLDEGKPAQYPQSLAAVVRLGLDRLDHAEPAAAALARLCSFLAPEPVPAPWFPQAAAALPGPLATAAADPMAWRHIVAQAASSALVRVDHDNLQMHRLTQAVIREQLPADQARANSRCAEAVLAAAAPGEPDNPQSWAEWARLMPHLLAARAGDASDPQFLETAADAAWYLLRRGDKQGSRDYASYLFRSWRSRFGEDSQHTLQAAHVLAQSLQVAGLFNQARDLDRDAHGRRRRVLGDDHPSTLTSANNLATDLRALGQVQAAHDLDRQTLQTRRRVFGDDHPSTLTSANNLAVDLRALGQMQAARDLDQDTLDRRRRVLGHDHPDTLVSASNLANDLRALGDHEAARSLDLDAFDRRRRVLGEDHPGTLNSGSNLANDLRALGDYEAARLLDHQTWQQRCRLLGDDHPSTLVSANGLAADLRALGQAEAARDLDQDTLNNRRRVLGDDHPSTLTSVTNLAADLQALGDQRALAALARDFPLESPANGTQNQIPSPGNRLATDTYEIGEIQNRV